MPTLKKINLLEETIRVENIALSKAFACEKEFGICLDGSIKYLPFETKDIFIYQGKGSAKEQDTQHLLGLKYTLKEENKNVLINASKAWKEILTYNLSNCDYHNTSDNEVPEFTNEKIEDMSWMIIDFDVTYKEMFTFLEENVQTTLLCIESFEPYQSVYMGYFDDISITEKVFFDFCQNTIKDKLANDADYTYDYLDEDQREAVEYFKAKDA